MKTLGQRIKELRMKKGMTQIELAVGICTPSMISQCESDRARPSYKVLFAIAEKLDAALESLLLNVDMNLEYQSTYKMARSMVANKKYVSAIPLLQDLLDAPRTQVLSSKEILMLLGESYLYTDALELAESVFENLKIDFTTARDSQMLSEVLKNLGVLKAIQNQSEVAVYHFEHALEELAKVEQPDDFFKAEILMNFGHVREKQGKVKQAIELFDQAKGLYARKQTPQEMANVYAELGRSYHRLNEPEKAMEYSDISFALFQSLDNVYMSVKIQLTAAIAYGQSGREEEAIQTLETVIKKFQELGQTEDTGIAFTELAKVRLALDDTEGAAESCRIARSLLPELHVYQAWVNRTLGEIEVKLDNRVEAIRRLQMAGDCFKQHGKIGEWADTMAKLSQLKLEENDVSGAISIMECIRVTTRNALSERGIVL